MPTKTPEIDHSKQVTVDPSVSGALLDRIQVHQKRLDDRHTANINVKKDDIVEKDEWGDEIKPNDPPADPPAAKKDEDGGDPPADAAKPPETDGDPAAKAPEGLDFTDYLEENKTTKQDMLDSLMSDPSLKIKVPLNGRDRKMNSMDLNVAVERGAQFQQKYDKLATSDEVKLGTLMAAARKGDKEATKKVLNLLQESSGKENIDDMVDHVGDAKGEFNEEGVLAKQQKIDEEDRSFPDIVKNSVDFEKHLATMRADLRGPIPAKVYDFYDESPEKRRIMYDLVAQGIHNQVMDKFYNWYDELEPTEQSRLDNDPAAWGTAFTSVFDSLKRKNERASKNAGSERPSEPMDSVSDGSKGRSRKPPEVKSYKTMSDKEFREERMRLIGR